MLDEGQLAFGYLMQFVQFGGVLDMFSAQTVQCNCFFRFLQIRLVRLG